MNFAHISYHPVRTELARTFAGFGLSEDGPNLARDFCSLRGLDGLHTDRLLELVSDQASPATGSFDQTHGFQTAVLQGFFDRFFYVHEGSLSSLGDLLAPYTQPWHEVVEDQLAEDAANHLDGEHSSGVFIRADMIAQFMHDTHHVTELTQALADSFPGSKAQVLWMALQAALDSQSGLLEASGVIVPQAADLQASECYAKLTNCDAASLQFYVDANGVPMTATTVPQPVAAAPAATQPVAKGGLAERLRAKRLAPQAPAIPEPAPAGHAAAPAVSEPAPAPTLSVAPPPPPPPVPVSEPAQAEAAVAEAAMVAEVPAPEPVESVAPLMSADPLGDLHMQLASVPVHPDIAEHDLEVGPASPDREIPDVELIGLLLETLGADAPAAAGPLRLVPDLADELTAVAASTSDMAAHDNPLDGSGALTPWVAIVPAGSEDRIALDVNDFVGNWEPFSAIETGVGTAVVRYQQSDVDTLRVFGVHVDVHRPEPRRAKVFASPPALAPNHLALVSVGGPVMHCPAQDLVSG